MKNLKMFNPGIKGSQRCNGLVSNVTDKNGKSKTLSHNNYIKIVSPVGSKDTYNNIKHGDSRHRNSSMLYSTIPPHGIAYSNDIKIKSEPDDQEYDDKVTAHSIIGLGEDVLKTHKVPALIKQRYKQGSIRATHHETLQRIDLEEETDNIYQQHWFSASIEKFKLEDRSREERIEITRHELMRYLQQLTRSGVGVPNKLPSVPPSNIVPRKHHIRSKYLSGYDKLVTPKICEVEECGQCALPCAKHCTLHVMLNTDQVLFDYCTAKFADNTQCSIPVFDITHELPLCPEHARKRDNYKLNQEAKPKKLRKKVKPSAMIRPQKRSKKKKRPSKPVETTTQSAIINIPTTTEVSEIIKPETTVLEPDIHMVDHVLGLDQPDVLEQELGTQASHLLETDISNVLSTIQVDEFTDFFTVNRNGEYEEPSREEAEELEKALAAVDNDVKSLEKLSQTHGLLDSLLDEQTLTDSLVQIPDVFHNGYPPCGDSMVAQTSSFLLPVEPHSHS